MLYDEQREAIMLRISASWLRKYGEVNVRSINQTFTVRVRDLRVIANKEETQSWN